MLYKKVTLREFSNEMRGRGFTVEGQQTLYDYYDHPSINRRFCPEDLEKDWGQFKDLREAYTELVGHPPETAQDLKSFTADIEFLLTETGEVVCKTYHAQPSTIQTS